MMKLVEIGQPLPRQVNDDIIESTAGSVFFPGMYLQPTHGTSLVTLIINVLLEIGQGVQESNEAVLNTTDRSSEELLPMLNDLVVQDKTLPIPCYILKGISQNHHFFGRKSILKNIDEALLPGRPHVQGASQFSNEGLRAFALCGLGGVGKTQIAIEYAFSRRDQYDAIFWIEADENTKLADGFGNIATQLGFNDAADTDRVISRNVVLEWLSTPMTRPTSSTISGTPDSQSHEASWLLIFNNIDDLELLGSYWPIGGAGSILLTSRDPLAKKDRIGVDLESFPTPEAAEFLRRKLDLDDRMDHVTDSVALAERFGGLPLAISQIAALIERWEMTMKEFLEFYDKETSKAAVTKDNPTFLRDSYYKHSLFTVWALESLSKTALLVLQVVSFLNPDAVQESLFTECKLEHLPQDFPTADVSYIKARAELTKVSLVKRVKENSIITLHRLVQDVVQAHMPNSLTVEMFTLTVYMVLKAWPTGFLQFDHETVTWEKSEELLQHILKLNNAAQNHTSWDLPINTTMELAKLLLFAGW